MERFPINSRFVYRLNLVNPYIFFDQMTEFMERDVLNHVLDISMQEDEALKKDDDLELDCVKKTCNKEGMECIICLEKIKLGGDVFECKGCLDKFHYSCINKWIKMKNSCPKCRKIIPVRSIDSDGFEEWIDNQLKL